MTSELTEPCGPSPHRAPRVAGETARQQPTPRPLGELQERPELREEGASVGLGSLLQPQLCGRGRAWRYRGSWRQEPGLRTCSQDKGVSQDAKMGPGSRGCGPPTSPATLGTRAEVTREGKRWPKATQQSGGRIHKSKSYSMGFQTPLPPACWKLPGSRRWQTKVPSGGASRKTWVLGRCPGPE